MMQISQDKVSSLPLGFPYLTLSQCGGAPDGNCKDPDFNIHQGTQFLAETLAKNKGNLLREFIFISDSALSLGLNVIKQLPLDNIMDGFQV